ncbi:uncharacterized protein MYCFIDRAFT_180938 [Pseudocercospora fijiensis CIRAD86]|uniref:Uncharacterized protein n=1 Tax=Pseudocercospora fijiensis (strain CIRAD86) TaxID=383855 RepID=N1Q767_PSEFD|nr:uncharacterized protein MYCFIDRAFT_180938 [Pseudocercospora fijiensis CIRAD86]EME87386.1 hypothetical protein MYCFIDRAFT_180938 [Pseudocercospora fijiensis CIRAD86]
MNNINDIYHNDEHKHTPHWPLAAHNILRLHFSLKSLSPAWTKVANEWLFNTVHIYQPQQDNSG